MKYMKRIFLLILILLAASASAIKWDTPIVYDPFTVYNATLWDNTTVLASGATGSLTEVGGTLRTFLDHVGPIVGSSSNTLTSILIPTNITQLDLNVTIEATTGGSGSTAASTNLVVFGNTLTSVSCAGGGSCSVVNNSNWTLQRNGTKYDVFAGGVFQSQITPSSNNLTSSGSLGSASAGSVNSINFRMFVMNYSYGNESMTITLNEPGNNSVRGTTNIVFNVSTNTIINELQNVTLYLDGGVNETVTVNGTSNESIFVKNLTDTDHNWSAFVCDTDNNCKSSVINFFTVNPLVENSLTFTSVTTEGQNERFELNITVDAGITSLDAASFFYNGTAYAPTINQISTRNFSLTNTLNAPAIASDTNFTLYWEMTIDGVKFNSTSNEQQVNNLGIDACGSFTNLILNYTLRDEEDPNLDISGKNPLIELDVDIFPKGSRTPIIEFSQNYTNVTNASVCLENALGTSQYDLDVITKYSTDDRVTEHHNFQNETLNATNFPKHIDLLDLLSVDSQEFLITFKDANFVPLENALIVVKRQYVSEGLFRTVEIPKTDNDGRTVAHLVLNDIVYNIEVYYFGELLASFDNVRAFCDDVVVGDCRLNLNALGTTTQPGDLTIRGGIRYTSSYDKNTKTYQVVFSTTSGAARTVNLTTLKYDNYLNETLCHHSLTASSGTLNCVIPTANENQTVITRLYSGNILVAQDTYLVAFSLSDTLDNARYILAALLIGTLPLIAFSSGPIMIFLFIIGLVFAGMLFLVDWGGFIGATSAFLWFVIAAGVIIWKITQGDE